MVSHAPAELNHAPLTLALVDAEASIAASPLPPELRNCAIRIARAIPFRERTWNAVFVQLALAIGDAPAREAADQLIECAFSQKVRDVDTLIGEVMRGIEPPKSIPAVPRTIYLERLISASA
jgi:hypothetical protein